MSWSESWWITRNIVKSVQRGTTTGAQTVTINAVNMEKSFVISTSKGSAGYVAARGDITGNLEGNITGYSSSNQGRPTNYSSSTSFVKWLITDIYGTRTLSGGSTDLTTKQYSARLISSTQLQCDGAVEWQVIEFY